MFRLVESDVGRPLTHVRSRFDSETLQEDAERVLRTLATTERQINSNENNTRYMMRILPYRTADNVINGVVLTFTDITRITAAEARIEELTRDLRARIDELEAMLDLVPVGVMIVASDGGPEVMINTYGARLLGAEERHRGLKPAVMPIRLFENGEELPPERQPLERAARTGETVSTWQGLLKNEQGHEVHVMISATPLFAEGGEVRGAVAAIIDISPHKQAEAQQRFLLNELQHRVKNILATIGSLATRMSRGQSSITDFQNAFLGRLTAMGRTHDLLTEGTWSGTSLRSLLETALEPHASPERDNVELTGPDVRLTSGQATTLGMVFHELATNASKYGALSNAGGHVAISWKLLDSDPSGHRCLELSWMEHRGPLIGSSRSSGFGTGFILRSVEYELTGKASLDFLPEGVRCTIKFPLADEFYQALPDSKT